MKEKVRFLGLDVHAETIAVAIAERQLAEFAAQWDRQYPSIGALWRRNWQGVIPFFQFPPEIRKIVYTTNAIESLNMSLRKAIKTRGEQPGLVCILSAMEPCSTYKPWHDKHTGRT